MANLLSFRIGTDVSGRSLFIIDKTGEYAASNNEGGYGTPNLNLSDLALVGYVERIDHEGNITSLTPDSEAIVFNATAQNSDENNIEFEYDKDGHHKATLFALKVSDDDQNYISGGVINDEEYYYFSGSIFQKQGLSKVDVTDFSVMVGQSSVIQLTCEDILFTELKIKNGKNWQEYKNFRNIKDTQNACDKLEEFQGLYFDIIGTDYDFRSGLVAEARANIKNMIDEYL